MDPVVGAALVSAIVAAGVAVGVQVIFRRWHEITLETVKADHARGLERLRSELAAEHASEFEMARTAIARELRDHEANLRIAAEYRLRLLDRELDSLAETRRVIRKLHSGLDRLGASIRDHGPTPSGQVAADEFLELIRSPDFGAYHPAEVEEGLQVILQGVAQIRDHIIEGAKLSSSMERREHLASISPAYDANAVRVRKLFRRWQDRIRSDGERLLGSLESPRPPQPKEDDTTSGKQ